MVALSDNFKYSDTTVGPTGKIPKELKDRAYKATEASMIVKFYSNLVKNKAGTHGVEQKAYIFALERKSKEGITVDPNDDIISGRDIEMVVDLLKVKIKYAKRAEDTAKRKFDTEMRKVEEKIEKGTRRWRKLRSKIQGYRNKVWKELEEKYDEKIEKLTKKYNAKTREKKTKEEEEEDKLIEGIVTKENELKEIVDKEDKIEIVLYGTLEKELDDDEKALLKLNPKFATFERIDLMKIREEIEIAKTKIRWDRRINGYGKDEEIQEEGEKLSTEEEEEVEKMELNMREIYDPDTGVFDMGKRRATDIKTNQRIYLPDPRPAHEEAELMIRMQRLEDAAKRYMQENCNEKGDVK